MASAVKLVHGVCCLAGAHSLLEDVRKEGGRRSLSSMIRQRDTPALFGWLVTALSYQGISDRVAAGYIEQHGSVTWVEVESALQNQLGCPKLESHWGFRNCNFQKAAQSCNNPQHIGQCPLPKHPLRNGRLNQTAYSLYLFVRDVAEGDLVGWIDQCLERAPSASAASKREAILGPLRHVYGVADKVLSMALASMLLAAPQTKPTWHEVGASFIAVDTLVHNWLHRTGILKNCGVAHPYGQRCVGENGCTAIIEKISNRIDARQFNNAFPKVFPRYIQFAIWRFCSIDALNVCNGLRIGRSRCKNRWCRLFDVCDRRSNSRLI